MKRKKAALYDPYLDTMGGGEKHILSILQILNESHDIDIFWHEDLSDVIDSKLHISFKHKPRFLNTWDTVGTLQKFQMLGAYDIFLYVTDGSYFFSSAKKNVAFCMVPQKSLYSMTPLNLLKTWNYTFISNSEYTKERLKGWEIFSEVIYPYIDSSLLHNDVITTKKPMILSVGRFFPHLHSKRQDIAIEWFKVLKKEFDMFQNYSLILAGSVQPEDEEYLHMLKGMANGRDDIIFKTNIAFEEMRTLYNDATFYWHLAGWRIDEKIHPEAVEHLGITPLEAMSSGCITCAYNIGGPAEIIKHDKTGYLFNNQQQLFEIMRDIQCDTEKQKKIQIEAKKYVVEHFSYEVFKKRVEEVLL